MTDHWSAVLAGFVAGMLTGWFSLAILSALVTSGRISRSEDQHERDKEE